MVMVSMVTQHPHQAFQLLVQLSFITRIHTSTPTSNVTKSKCESLCLHHHITIKHGERASTINKSTCAIQQTIQQLVQQLNNHAMSLTACVQYDWAPEDSAMMREIAPWSSWDIYVDVMFIRINLDKRRFNICGKQSIKLDNGKHRFVHDSKRSIC